MENQQSVSAIKQMPNGALALLGSNDRSDLHFDPTVFFISDEGPTGYIYSSPTRLDFGVVPLGETSSTQVQLFLTGDTSAIITDYTIPENFATGLLIPDTITSDKPFEFLEWDFVRLSDESTQIRCASSAARSTRS